MKDQMFLFLLIGWLQSSLQDPIMWSIFISILFGIFGVKLQCIKDTSIITEIAKKGFSTMHGDRGKPIGFVFGFIDNTWTSFFIGKFTTSDNKECPSPSFYIVCLVKILEQLQKVDNKSNNGYTMYTISGCSNYDKYPHSAKCDFKGIKPNKMQAILLKEINNEMVKKRTNHKIVSVFIYGPPGTGKSTMGDLILSKHKDLNPIYIKLNLFALGQKFEDIKKETFSITSVIVIDLGDIGEILRDNFKELKPNEIFNRIVYDKDSWNGFFDIFESEIYLDKQIYIIATSNVDVKDIDPSYTRKGRFDICQNFTEIKSSNKCSKK